MQRLANIFPFVIVHARQTHRERQGAVSRSRVSLMLSCHQGSSLQYYLRLRYFFFLSLSHFSEGRKKNIVAASSINSTIRSHLKLLKSGTRNLLTRPYSITLWFNYAANMINLRPVAIGGELFRGGKVNSRFPLKKVNSRC
jgi:hypothetical protein